MLQFTSTSHRKILQLIRMNQQISGAELSRLTSLRASTVGYILQHLNERALIDCFGYGKTTHKGGKKPLLWGINESAGYLIGMEVLRNQIRGVIASLSGKMVLRVEKDFQQIHDKNITARVSQIINEMIREADIQKHEILNTTIAIPGIIDVHQEHILYSAVLDISNFDLAGPVSNETGIETHLINDANAGALSDQWYTQMGPQETSNHIIYINYNQAATEMGLGIILNNRLYTGAKGTAGELLSNIPAIEEQFMTDKSAPKISLIDLYYKQLEGDALAAGFIHQINDYLRKEVSRLIGLFNPQRIILGGEISSCQGWPEKLLIPAVKEYINQNTRFSLYIPEIKFSPFGIFSVALGATAYTLSKELNV